MIELFYRAGSIQTDDAVAKAIQADLCEAREVILLVPEQQTVSVERRMLSLLPPQAQLHFEVVNFSRLANRVFRTLGGHRWNTATPAVRALLMWRTLHRTAPLLLQYADHAGEMRLCDMMLESTSHLHAYGITCDKISETAELLPEGEPLRKKLHDIALILADFEQTLKERFDNGDEDLDRLALLLQEHGASLLSNAHVYVDSFTDYTAQELLVLRALMRHAPKVGITLPLSSPADDGIHLESARHTHRVLVDMANELLQPIHTVKIPAPRPTLAHEYVAQNLFCMDAEPAPLALLENSNVTVLACDNPFSEADAAAAHIHHLVRECGCHYRDITVVLRDATSCCGILDAALEREGIPFFLSEKTDVTTRPLIKLILLALRIGLHNYRCEDVVAYLKTALCGVESDDVNLFEEYVNLWHPRGEQQYAAPFTRNPDGYTMKTSKRGERILAGANRARAKMLPPLQHLFQALREAEGATQMCRALYQYLCELSVAEQLKSEAKARLAAGERREAEELSRLYAITLEALESIARALEDEPLSPAQLLEVLRLVFSRTDIGSIPTSVDEVTIGSASMLRTDHPRFLLVLGLNEGEFPRSVTDDALLSQNEKLRLAELGLQLPSDRTERASDELFYAYRAFCAPLEGLYLSHTTSSASGGSSGPSFVFARALKLLNINAKSVPFFENLPALSSIYTVGGALDRLSELPDEAREELTGLLEKSGAVGAANLRRPVVERRAAISAPLAASVMGKKGISPSRFDSYSRCHFAYFCRYVLFLREEKSDVLDLLDVGTFIHYVLEHAIKEKNRDGRPFSAWSDEEILALTKRLCTSYQQRLEAAAGELSPRSDALMQRLESLTRLIVCSLFEEFADSQFRPSCNELKLEQVLSQNALELENGASVPISGQVDRVDTWTSPEGESFLRVVDYKTGTKEFDPADIRAGQALQMPIYLKALCQCAHPKLNAALDLSPETKLKPAGVTYFSSAIKAETTHSRISEQEAMLAAKSKLKRSGVLLDTPALRHAASQSSNPKIPGIKKNAITNEDFEQMFRDLDDTLLQLSCSMKQGQADARPNTYNGMNPCASCSFAAICRAARLHKKGEETNDA